MPNARHALHAGIAAAMLLCGAAASRAEEPIKIGFSMELTGPFAVIGKTGLLAFKIWEEEINAKGGLLGRAVKLVYYDDQSNPANVPGIYTKLISVDRVDLLIGPYATNLVAAAMPVIMQNNKMTIGMLSIGISTQFHYPRYFSMVPLGPAGPKAFSEGVFALA